MFKFLFGAIFGSLCTALFGAVVVGKAVQNPSILSGVRAAVSDAMLTWLYGPASPQNAASYSIPRVRHGRTFVD